LYQAIPEIQNFKRQSVARKSLAIPIGEGDEVMKVGKFVGTFVSASVLSLLLGFTALSSANLLYAQDQHDDAKPQQPDARPEAAKPDDAKRAQDEKPAPDEHAKPSQQNDKPQANDDKSRTDNKDNNKDNNMRENDNNVRQDNERSAQQANHGQSANMAQHGTRIPDDKFHANFGRQHTFVMQRPTIVGGQPQFQYGGFSFMLVDAWPAGWAYTDQCYIDYINGEYVLVDLAHPGVTLVIEVV
jgi:hypothetical protein